MSSLNVGDMAIVALLCSIMKKAISTNLNNGCAGLYWKIMGFFQLMTGFMCNQKVSDIESPITGWPGKVGLFQKQVSPEMKSMINLNANEKSELR